MKTYEVLKDTKIIEDNTADALQVKVSTETPVMEYSDGNNTVKGDNLVVMSNAYLNLGVLKAKLIQLDQELITLQAERDETQANIDAITPHVDQAITEILKDAGAVDNRAITP